MKGLKNIKEFERTQSYVLDPELRKIVNITIALEMPLLLKGEPGTPRQWVYVELDGRRYVRDKRWKLTGQDALFDMKEAPFNEIAVPADSSDPEAVAARKRLHETLIGLVGAERLAQPPLPPPVKRKAAKKAAAAPATGTPGT
jgi:hypothetical protein